MLQKALSTVVLLGTFILLTAMGGTGGVERLPRVEKNFAVTITDATGVVIDGEKFSWEGRIQFSGYFGLAQVTLPFEKIKVVNVGEKRDRQVKVTVRLKDGSETNFDIDAKTRCYGEAKFGNFMLLMSEIKTITFK
jgi:hypothetical protein